MSPTTRSSIALGLLVLWFVVAVVVRAGLHLSRTGSLGIKGISSSSSLEMLARLLFIDAIVAAPAAAVLHPWLPSNFRPSPGWTAPVGIVVMALGIFGTVLAQRAMGTSWRIGVDTTERTALVTSGVFGQIRNPIYTAMLVTGTGLLLLVPNVITLAAYALMFVALELVVRAVEEPFLVRQHGAAYTRYAAEVGRFLPGVGRRRA